MKINLVGVVNVTPDSFSDGNMYYSEEKALNRYEQLIHDGASIVEFGADSSRPGSECVGSAEEIKRLHFINSNLNFGVDTHIYETAIFALQKGAKYINDISASLNLENKLGDAKLVLMNSSVPPHQFSYKEKFNFDKLISKLKVYVNNSRIDYKQIIIDPGMGSFISDNPKDSLFLLDNFNKILDLGFDVMLGISRKGFLKSFGISTIEELDFKGLELTKKLINKFNKYNNHVYLRVHNVKIYQGLLC